MEYAGCDGDGRRHTRSGRERYSARQSDQFSQSRYSRRATWPLVRAASAAPSFRSLLLSPLSTRSPPIRDDPCACLCEPVVSCSPADCVQRQRHTVQQTETRVPDRKRKKAHTVVSRREDAGVKDKRGTRSVARALIRGNTVSNFRPLPKISLSPLLLSSSAKSRSLFYSLVHRSRSSFKTP